MNRPLCIHCHRNVRSNSGRGLCRGCWNQSRIRNRYRPKKSGPRAEPTEAELEVIIAEQLANKPSWWDGAYRED